MGCNLPFALIFRYEDFWKQFRPPHLVEIGKSDFLHSFDPILCYGYLNTKLKDNFFAKLKSHLILYQQLDICSRGSEIRLQGHQKVDLKSAQKPIFQRFSEVRTEKIMKSLIAFHNPCPFGVSLLVL